jgi:hypothetical protein
MPPKQRHSKNFGNSTDLENGSVDEGDDLSHYEEGVLYSWLF